MVHPLSPIQDQIDEYFPSETHPYALLENEIERYINDQASVLDIGCGRTAPNLKRYVGQANQLTGIDVVEFPAQIPGLNLLNESITAMQSVPDNSIDIAYSRSVMEHILESDLALAEVARVLKPGGRYLFLTANMYDYASLMARIIPNRLHPWVVRRTEGRDEIDTFPTTYTCNSKRTIYKLADQAQLEVARFERQAQYPNYLKFSRPLFWLGSQYERVIRKFEFLSVLRGWIYCEVRKPAA